MHKIIYVMLAIGVFIVVIVIWYLKPDHNDGVNSAIELNTEIVKDKRNQVDTLHVSDLGHLPVEKIQDQYIKTCVGKAESCEQKFWGDMADYWNVDEVTAKTWFKDVQEHEESLNNVSLNTSDYNVRFQTFWDLHVKAFGREKAEKIYGKQKALYDFDSQTEEIFSNELIIDANQRVQQWEKMKQETLGNAGLEFKNKLDQEKLYKIELALWQKDRLLNTDEKQLIYNKYFPE